NPFNSGDKEVSDNLASALFLKKIISGTSNPGFTASIASCGKSIICNKISSLPVFLAMFAAVFNALPACSEKSVGTNIFFINKVFNVFLHDSDDKYSHFLHYLHKKIVYLPQIKI